MASFILALVALTAFGGSSPAARDPAIDDTDAKKPETEAAPATSTPVIAALKLYTLHGTVEFLPGVPKNAEIEIAVDWSNMIGPKMNPDENKKVTHSSLKYQKDDVKFTVETIVGQEYTFDLKNKEEAMSCEITPISGTITEKDEETEKEKDEKTFQIICSNKFTLNGKITGQELIKKITVTKNDDQTSNVDISSGTFSQLFEEGDEYKVKVHVENVWDTVCITSPNLEGKFHFAEAQDKLRESIRMKKTQKLALEEEMKIDGRSLDLAVTQEQTMKEIKHKIKLDSAKIINQSTNITIDCVNIETELSKHVQSWEKNLPNCDQHSKKLDIILYWVRNAEELMASIETKRTKDPEFANTLDDAEKLKFNQLVERFRENIHLMNEDSESIKKSCSAIVTNVNVFKVKVNQFKEKSEIDATRVSSLRGELEAFKNQLKDFEKDLSIDYNNYGKLKNEQEKTKKELKVAQEYVEPSFGELFVEHDYAKVKEIIKESKEANEKKILELMKNLEERESKMNGTINKANEMQVRTYIELIEGRNTQIKEIKDKHGEEANKILVQSQDETKDLKTLNETSSLQESRLSFLKDNGPQLKEIDVRLNAVIARM